MNYLKYCIIARNEIKKFDAYAYEIKTPVFKYKEGDFDHFADYHALKEEKRRLRWLHILKYSSNSDVKRIQDNLPAGITYDDFATNISKAYRLISVDIHNLCCTALMKSQYCLNVTSDKKANECINLVMANVEIDVGKMLSDEPPHKKSKPDHSL